MKTRRAAGVKRRLKSAEARQFFEHREVSIRNWAWEGQSTRSIED